MWINLLLELKNNDNSRQCYKLVLRHGFLIMFTRNVGIVVVVVVAVMFKLLYLAEICTFTSAF